MLRLRNRLLPLLRAGTQLPSPIHNGGSRLLLSTSTSTTPFSLEDYLVASCGLAPAQARSTSKKALAEASRASVMAFNELSSARQYPGFDPDGVLALLSRIGLSRADIADVVAADPLILRSRVGILEPRLLGLRDSVGLSLPQIARLLVVNSRMIRRRAQRDVGPNIRYFLSFYGSFEKLMVLSKGNNTLVTVNLDSVVKPNIALLRQCGLSAPDIARLSSTCPRLLTSNPERVKEFVLRAEELGVPRSSRMFQYALSAVGNTTKESNAAKLEFLKITLGCSKSEVATAVSKMPTILGNSDENLLRKIQFMIKEVGLEPQYILQRPVLLALSLEKRLVPRYRVIKVLLAKGLLKSNLSFYTIFKIGEKTFRSRFVTVTRTLLMGLKMLMPLLVGAVCPPVTSFNILKDIIQTDVRIVTHAHLQFLSQLLVSAIELLLIFDYIVVIRYL